jgi:lipopolysaccharide transport system ATP-binding protein
MSENVIVVENLSKRYLIGHRFRSGTRSNYVALRDVIGREIRNFARKAADVVRGRQVVQGDAVEEFWALKDVSFEVKQGEVLGIIGRNGAGKSTLLKLLSRITEPTKGRIALRGRVSSLLEVGTGFHPELTGRENIFLNGAVLGMTQWEVRKKFDEIVAFAEVETFLDTPVKHFSSGMYVRLAFAVAAHLEPEILIVDEVLAVGDLEFQKKCLGRMTEVARGGRTILFVSHNHAAIRSLCTHGLILRDGTASAKASVTSALENYALDRQTSLASSWRRPENLPKPAVYFVSIDVQQENRQPKLTLLCSSVVKSAPGGRPVFISVDIADRSSSVIMQAEPSCEPFIARSPGLYRVDLTIELPPLIPGFYTLDFWIGPHNTETVDWIRQAVTIEIVESPNPRRSFPYTIDHGSIVPISTASVSVIPIEPQLCTEERCGNLAENRRL